MNTLKFYLLSAFAIFGIFTSTTAAAQKTKLMLSCPMDNVDTVGKIKSSFAFAELDQYITFVSKTDSLVKSVVDGKITNVDRSFDGKYDVVIFKKFNGEDYYVWFSGLEKPLVAVRDNVSTGSAIAVVKPGEKFDVAIYKGNDQLNIRPYLGCVKPVTYREVEISDK